MKENHITLLLIAFLFVVFIFFLTTGDNNLIYSTERGPALNLYNSPIMITPSRVKAVRYNASVADIDVLSPTKSFNGGTLYDVPSGNFSTTLRRQVSFKRYNFSENDRKFGSIGEKLCCKIFEEFLEREILVGLRPDFLKNPETKRNLELDVYDPVNKVAIEYSGVQHFSQTSVFHNDSEDLTKQIKRDQLKIQLCKKANIKLIVVPYTVDSAQKGFDGKWKYVKRTTEEREKHLSSYIIPFLNEYYLK